MHTHMRRLLPSTELMLGVLLVVGLVGLFWADLVTKLGRMTVYMEEWKTNRQMLEQVVRDRRQAQQLRGEESYLAIDWLVEFTAQEQLFVIGRDAGKRLGILVTFPRHGCGRRQQRQDEETRLIEFRVRIAKQLLPSLQFVIIVAEQEPTTTTTQRMLNQGVLFNAAFVVALRKYNVDYVVFHGGTHVMMPSSYELPPRTHTPLRMCGANNKLVAAATVLLMRSSEVVQVNGFSTRFVGWGSNADGDDEDMNERIMNKLGRRPRTCSSSFHRPVELGIENRHPKLLLLRQPGRDDDDGISAVHSRVKFVRHVEEGPSYYRFLITALEGEETSEPPTPPQQQQPCHGE